MEKENIKRKHSGQIIIGIVIIIVGIALTVYAGINIFVYYGKSRNYIAADSKVIDYDYNYTDNGEQLGTSVITYTVDGKTYKKKSEHYSSTPDPIGTLVKIKYNPDDPSDIIWLNDKNNFILPIIGILAVIGGVLTIKDMPESNESQEEKSFVSSGEEII